MIGSCMAGMKVVSVWVGGYYILLRLSRLDVIYPLMVVRIVGDGTNSILTLFGIVVLQSHRYTG